MTLLLKSDPASAPGDYVAPLLKWAGGKRALLRELLPLIPQSHRKYFEPFAGGAALFFALQPKTAVISDTNADLVNCYQQVRDEPDRVIGVLRSLRNTEATYYRVRSWNPRAPIQQAARLIYLVTLSFNGIYRQNLHGDFNVPYGQKKYLDPADPDRVRTASRVLQNAEIKALDFEAAVVTAKRGDIVYLDPPYTVAHGNNGFIKYNAKIFSWDDQLRLARVAQTLVQRGCCVIISNAMHQSILSLYKGFDRIVVHRKSAIAADSSFRGQVSEYIFYNEGKGL
jgi:DNA adenine methylase